MTASAASSWQKGYLTPIYMYRGNRDNISCQNKTSGLYQAYKLVSVRRPISFFKGKGLKLIVRCTCISLSVDFNLLIYINLLNHILFFFHTYDQFQ